MARAFLVTTVAAWLLLAVPAEAQVLRPMGAAALNADSMALWPQQPDAVALNSRLSAVLNPAVRSWIQSDARSIAARNLASDAMLATARSDIAGRFAGQKLGATDVESLVVMMFMVISMDAQADLKAMLGEIDANRAKKRQARAAPAAQKTQKLQADSLSDLTNEQQLRLQIAMERRSKTEQMLSNIMKKVSATNSSLIQNLK
jgi:hypothetical protein